MPATAIFLINLVQDVSVLRPLVFMASRDFGMHCLLLVSTKFTGRDLFGIWRNELAQIAEETGARLEYFESDWEARQHLVGQGVIFAASESHLHNHVTTHSVFRYAPREFLRVTLQHGFECVGFRHSADHVRAHGPSASFGADLVCSWYGADQLLSMSPSQRRKLVVAGPTSVLQMPDGPAEPTSRGPGIVCENLHSVRLNGAGDFKSEFVAAFDAFCDGLAGAGAKVVLRPHPGGQYVLKNKVPLPPNTTINNAPMYRVDLRRFAYGISAPSSVLLDMVLAGIPTAVWRDRHGDMDANNYAGLTTVSTPEEWVEFARTATADPQPFLDLQKEFLDSQGLVLEPAEVYSRYAAIFDSVGRREVRPLGAAPERERILFVANANVPTLQLSFEKPLAPLVARGEITTQLLTETQLREQPDLLGDSAREAEWLNRHLDSFGPSIVIFCRYSGPAYRPILEWARRQNVPVMYHIDDDLLAIPEDIGARKHALHNAPERLETVRELLGAADLVYASTDKLRARLLEYFPGLPLEAGKIYCSGAVLQKADAGPTRTIGYMASADHAHNLARVLPAIEQLLDRNPGVQFELFGSIRIPEQLKRFGDRVSTAPPVANYGDFLSEFAARGWHIGICPLSPIDFNLMKANTKWVEYTSVGAAVVASRGTVYDACCAGGCGILADGPEEWLSALESLIHDNKLRLAMVARAQEKLEREYSIGRLREQVLEMIGLTHKAARQRFAHSRKAEVLVS